VVKRGRRVTDFVSLADLAPTFVEAAGEAVPPAMTGRSLMPLLRAEGGGRIDPSRDHVLVGRERHTPAQEAPSTVGYPQRAIRTDDYLYVKNFEPDRWPVGSPRGSTRGPAFSDCDDSPTKQYLVDGRDDPAIKRFYDLAFAKRPTEELYDLAKDPDQVVNLADDPALADIKAALAARLDDGLRVSGDPRMFGRGHELETFPYLGGGAKRRTESNPAHEP
jgi:arylsulfatase A-like enzyme